jgi:hypothetical protein
MPDDIKPNPLSGGTAPANANANNDDVARKLAAQDQAGRSNSPDAAGIEEAGSALDKHFQEMEEAAKKAAETPNEPEVKPAPKEPTPEERAAAEKEAADKAAATAAAEEQRKKADDLFKDAPALPQNASPKAVEAFATVKLQAAQKISKLQQELEAAKKAAQELEQKTKTPPPELEAANQELADLRAWRAKLDVEADPKFKDFDTKMDKARDTIYELLKESPIVSQKVIDQIKSFGGPDKSDLSKLFEAMKDPTLQRMVENKILDIKTAHIEKEQAVKATKGNVQQWMEEQKKAKEAESTTRVETTKKELDGFLGGLEWFRERTPDAKATEAEKKQITEDNALTKQLREELNAAVGDDSPRTKAILLTGLVQLTRLQKVHEGTLAKLATTEKELTEAKAFVEKIKASSTSRLRESAAPVDGKLPQPKADIFNTPATSALDALAAQITEQRRAQGS